MSEPTKIKVFYQSGDTPFIVWAHGPISSNMLASIESDIEKDPPSEFEDYGNGTYCYDVEWDSGQYDEYGRCEFPSGWELMFTAFEKMNPEAAQPAPKEDAELEQLLRERDDLEAVINRILDLVLGSDRHEWSSAYEYTDALLDVEERMAALDMVPDARTCGSSDGSLRNPCPQHGEAKRCRYCKRAEGQGCGDEAMAQNTGAEPRCMREPEAQAGVDVVDGEVLVAVHGLTGSGKSAVAGEIEILCKALGLEVRWENGDEEKFLTHADWTHALELYKPRVRIIEINTTRNKQ